MQAVMNLLRGSQLMKETSHVVFASGPEPANTFLRNRKCSFDKIGTPTSSPQPPRLAPEPSFGVWRPPRACLAPHSLLTGSTCECEWTDPDTPHPRKHEVHVWRHKCTPRHTPLTHTRARTACNPLTLVAPRERGVPVWLY